MQNFEELQEQTRRRWAKERFCRFVARLALRVRASFAAQKDATSTVITGFIHYKNALLKRSVPPTVPKSIITTILLY